MSQETLKRFTYFCYFEELRAMRLISPNPAKLADSLKYGLDINWWFVRILFAVVFFGVGPNVAVGDTIVRIGYPRGIGEAQLDAILFFTTRAKAIANSRLVEINEQDLIHKTLAGKLDVALIPLYLLSKHSRRFRVFEEPFYFADFLDVEEKLQGIEGESLRTELNRLGLVHLGWWHGGMLQLGGRVPILWPNDLKGLNVLSTSPKPRIWVSTFGAKGVEDLFLSGGVIRHLEEGDIVESTLPEIVEVSEPSLAVTKTNHLYRGFVLIANQTAWRHWDLQLKKELRYAVGHSTNRLNEKIKRLDWVAEQEFKRRDRTFFTTLRVQERKTWRTQWSDDSDVLNNAGTVLDFGPPTTRRSSCYFGDCFENQREVKPLLDFYPLNEKLAIAGIAVPGELGFGEDNHAFARKNKAKFKRYRTYRAKRMAPDAISNWTELDMYRTYRVKRMALQNIKTSWNVWFEDSQGQSTEKLTIEQKYRINVDLSRLAYKEKLAGNLDLRMQSKLIETKTGEITFMLQPVLLGDNLRSQDGQALVAKPITIQMERLEAKPTDAAEFEKFQTGEQLTSQLAAKINLGSVVSWDIVPDRTGCAEIALSVWDESRTMPLDNLTIAIPVQGNQKQENVCPFGNQILSTGLQSLLATSQTSPDAVGSLANAALYVFETFSARSVAVFVDRDMLSKRVGVGDVSSGVFAWELAERGQHS